MGITARVELLKARFFAFSKMYHYDIREQSFVDWPFREECNCTPEKMAKAGFVHCPSENEPDIACCFFCLIELEGWEPDDDPWSEHVKRSPNCGFFTMNGADFTELTVSKYCQLEQDRLKIYIRKLCHTLLADLRDDIDKVLAGLTSLLETV